MKPLVLVSALCLTAMTMPAGAQTSAPAPVKAPDATPANDQSKVVCKEQPIEGTRFLKRVCLTRAAWTQTEQRAAAKGSPTYSIQQDPTLYTPHVRGVPMQ